MWAARKEAGKYKEKKGELSGEELAEQLDTLVTAGLALTDANGDKITSEHYMKVMLKEKNKEKKKKWARKVNLKAKGGYLAVFDVDKSTGSLRRCMHDTAVNAATRVGAQIDIKQLLREVPARKTVDTSVEEIMSAPSVASAIDFEYVSVNHVTGGNEAALISIEDGGVYFVLAQVDGAKAEYHAFVYDSTGTVPNEKPHSGLLIDNRKKAAVFLIEDSDRASVESKRKVLNDFFKARTFVLQVYRVTKKMGEPDREKEADKCRASFDTLVYTSIRVVRLVYALEESTTSSCRDPSTCSHAVPRFMEPTWVRACVFQLSRAMNCPGDGVVCFCCRRPLREGDKGEPSTAEAA